MLFPNEIKDEAFPHFGILRLFSLIFTPSVKNKALSIETSSFDWKPRFILHWLWNKNQRLKLLNKLSVILVHWYALSRLTFYYWFKVIVFFSVSSPRSGNEEGNGLKFEQHLFHENLLWDRWIFILILISFFIYIIQDIQEGNSLFFQKFLEYN